MYISGWVTLALIGGAIGTGIAYHDAKRSYESLLAEEEAPSNSLDEQRSAALRLGWINAGLTVGAALGVGLTTYLYWIRPAGPVRKGASGLQVAPWGTRSAAGVSVASEF